LEDVSELLHVWIVRETLARHHVNFASMAARISSSDLPDL
jgi:hypothetical protein